MNFYKFLLLMSSLRSRLLSAAAISLRLSRKRDSLRSLRSFHSLAMTPLLAIRYTLLAILFSSVPISSVPIYAAESSFTVTAGATVTLTNSATLDVDGDVIIDGSFDAGNGTVRLTEEWKKAGTFTYGTSTLEFYGTAISTISNSSTFYNLKCEASGKQVTFTDGTTQTVNNTLTLTGTSGNQVKLRSAVTGNKWDITFPNGDQTVNYIDVKDGNANTSKVYCRTSLNSGNNNANWIFEVQAILVYSSATVSTEPLYRTLDDSTTNWSDWAAATTLLSNTTFQHIVVKEAPTRTERILATLDNAGDIYVSTWAMPGGWSATKTLIEDAITATNDDYRGFDVAYESERGNGMIVFEDNTAQLKYRIWNGSSWGSESTVGISTTTGVPRWVRLERNPNTNSNEIALTWLDDAGAIGAKLWDGTTWWAEVLLSSAAALKTCQSMDVAYNEATCKPLFVFSDAANDYSGWVKSRSFNGSTWDDEIVATNTVEGARFLSLKPNTTGQFMLALNDAGDDITTVRYDGAWNTGVSHDAAANAYLNRVIDVCWENNSSHEGHCLLVFSDDTDTDFAKFDGNTWTKTSGLLQNKSNVVQLDRVEDKNIWLAAYEYTNAEYMYAYWNPVDHVWSSTSVIGGVFVPYTSSFKNFDLSPRAYTVTPTDAGNPGGISNLTALKVAGENSIKLEWTAPGDDQNSGDLISGSKFQIKYSTVSIIKSADFNSPPSNYAATSVDISTQTTALSYQTTTFFNLLGAVTYYFAIKTRDDAGNWSVWTSSADSLTCNTSAWIFTSNPPKEPAALTQMDSNRAPLPSMQWTNSATIISSFTLSDPEATEKVKFYLQVSSFSDYSLKIVNYTSALISQGTTEYQWPSLSDNGTYYWRVWAEDEWKLFSTTATTLGSGGDAKLGFDNTAPPKVTTFRLWASSTSAVNMDLEWSAVTDSLSGLASYYIYCSSQSDITDSNKGDADHYLLKSTATGNLAYTDNRDLLAPTSKYYYAVAGVDNAGNIGNVFNLSENSAKRELDGDNTDWNYDVYPSTINSSDVLTTKGSEFVWWDRLNDQRNDPPSPSDHDIQDIRLCADDQYLYFYVHIRNITDLNYPHVAISLDIDQDTADTGLDWNADDAGITLGAEYGNTTKNAHYGETNIIFHRIGDGAADFKIELATWTAGDGRNWYAPPTEPGQGGNYATSTDGKDFIEAKIARRDLGIEGVDKTLRLTTSLCRNVTFWANDKDTTWGYATCDAIDTASIIRISTGILSSQYYNDSAGDMNAWDEDINDGDIDFWMDIKVLADGTISDNTAPPKPTVPKPLTGGTTNQKNPNFSWSQDADADSGDKVESWQVELTTNSAFPIDISKQSGWRINRSTWNWVCPNDLIHKSTYYWRVWSRDRRGQLSATPDTWSTEVDTVSPRGVTTLSALTGSNNGEVNLSWLAPGDDFETGDLLYGSSFWIAYTTASADAEALTASNSQVIISTKDITQSNAQNKVVAGLVDGRTYYFRQWTSDDAGNFSPMSNAATAQAKGVEPQALLIYYSSSTAPADQQIPSYRRCDTTQWSSKSTTVDVGARADRQNVVRMCPPAKREEAIMVTLDDQGTTPDLNVSTYTPLGNWGLTSGGELATNVTINTKRCFDVAYEQTSGDAVIVYKRDTPTPAGLYFVVWNGTSLSAATCTGDSVPNVIQWVRLEPKPSADNMLLTFSDDKGSIYSYVWDGSTFTNRQDILTGYASAATAQPFDIAYTQSAGVGFVVWVDTNSTRPKYRTWDGYSWSAETTTVWDHSALGDPRWIKAATNPKNNEIMIGTFDNASDVNAEVFSSTLCAWLNGIEHDGAASTIIGDRAVDVAYEKSSGEGLVVWAEPNTVAARATPSAQTYKSGAWASCNASQNTILAGVDIVQLAPDDDTDRIFLVTLDSANYVYSQRFTGADAWDTLTEIENNSLDDYENFSMNFPKTAAPSDTIAPATVTSLSGATVSTSSGTIKLTWSSPGDDVWLGRLVSGSQYNITYCTSTANRVWFDWETTTSTEIAPGISCGYTKANLVGDTSYYCEIRYYDGIQWASLSNEATAYAAAPILSVSISTPVGGYNFGEVALGASTQSVAGASGSSITVTNNGNIVETFAIKCETNTAGSPWSTTGTAASADNFILRGVFSSTQPAFGDFGNDDIISSGTYKTSTSSVFSIGDPEDGVAVPVNDTIDLWLRLNMPTTSGTAATQEIILFIRAESP